MRIATKSLLAAFMTVLLAGSFALQVVACAPIYPVAIIVNWTHPDLPLKLFAAGNLGVIQPGWARSYLCVAYRYLTGTPLDKQEQASIIRLWHTRLKEAVLLSGEDTVSRVEAYLKLRDKVLGVRIKNNWDVYSTASAYNSTQNIQADAFDVARQTLEERIKKYGIRSNQVHEWLKGQDAVFGIDSSSNRIVLQPLSDVTDELMKADRNYQIAAAAFYSKNYDKAAQLFEQISKDDKSPWVNRALYLVARCKTNAAMTSDNADAKKQTIAYIQSMLKKENNWQTRQDLFDLLGPLYYDELTQAELLERLVNSVTHEHSERFGRDVGDLTFIMDGGGSDSKQNQSSNQQQPDTQEKLDFDKYDLTDWLDTIQRPDDYWSFYSVEEQKQRDVHNTERSQHAIDKWRQNHSIQWLVAAMCCNGLRSNQLNDAFEAAQKISSNSPAYLTANFFIIDALIASNKKQEARQRLWVILSRKDLPPSVINLFKAQLMCVSTNPSEFLHAAFMNLPGVCDTYIILSSNWIKQEESVSFVTDGTALDNLVARDINRNLPLSLWLELCRDKSLPLKLRNRIIAATWLRAQLLNKPAIASQLSSAFAVAYPMCAKLIREYNDAPQGDAKKFVLARLILSVFGMTPYAEPGVPRHGNTFNEFDYYNANFWLPLIPDITDTSKKDIDVDYWGSIVQPGKNRMAELMQKYYQPGIRAILSKQQKLDADAERLTIWKNHPSRFLGDAVFAWAKSHPNDPNVPEMLYKIIRLPKWCDRTDVGSLYSHKAYSLLHTRYPHNKWTDKATCWY